LITLINNPQPTAARKNIEHRLIFNATVM